MHKNLLKKKNGFNLNNLHVFFFVRHQSPKIIDALLLRFMEKQFSALGTARLAVMPYVKAEAE